MTLDAAQRSALRAVVPTARDVLADMDPDLVPNRLRKVAASSARTLPPPLEKALLDGIAADEVFRSSVSEAWSASESPDPVVSAFLDDPEAAMILVDAAAGRARVEQLTAQLAESEATRSDLEAQLIEARARNASLREASDKSLAARRESDKASRRGLEAAARDARDRAVAALERATALEAELGTARGEIRALEAALDRVAVRERRRDAASSGARTRPVASAANDPVSIAVEIDALERRVRPFREASGGDGALVPASGLSLPDGVVPDRAEAIDALVDARPDHIIIDGYNLAGVSGVADFASAEGRAYVETAATALARVSRSEVTVVFDAVGVPGRTRAVTHAGVAIVFAHEHAADDEIVELVSRTGASVAVVTNDRELRERVAEVGALAIWSDALIEWSKS